MNASVDIEDSQKSTQDIINLGQLFSHHGNSFPNPFDTWRSHSFDASLPFPQRSQKPSWCSRILMRVWDYRSSAQLNLQYDVDGRLRIFGSFLVDHEPPPAHNMLARQRALNSHSVWEFYELCFISTTRSFQDMRQRVRNICNQKGRDHANPVIITFIDAEILSQGAWLPLFALHEHQRYQVPLLKEGCSYTSPA